MNAMTYPCRLNAGLGRFHRLTEAEEIAQSVRLILTTRRGERPFRPEFGTRLDQFAFEIVNTTTKNLIRQEVQSALRMWEPRICNIEVDFDHRPEEGALLVNVSYQLLRDGQTGMVTVPLSAA